LQPSGNEFKESLKAASTALAPHIKSFEQLLTSISDEHRRLTIVERSLFSKKDELAKDLKKAQEAFEDVEKTTATENKMLRDLEDIHNKYPRDNELRMFLDKRKKTIIEHQEVYAIVKSQLDNRSAGLSKTENEIALVTRRLGQLEAARAEVVKEKEGVDKAAKRLIFMSRFMEPGWQATLDMLEQVSEDEALQTAFCVTTLTTSSRVSHKPHQSA
jgi:chromosome segregation ATPase